jgi:hypothetical protein
LAHVLKIGFKQNPTVGTDDCIDIGGSGNTGTNGAVGYHLLSYTEGNARVDQNGRMLRDLTITCEIKGSTVANSYFLFTEINRYLQRTRMYFEHFNGNIPAQTDLQWHTGRAATLSFQAQGASKMVYWDVLDGVATLPPNSLLGVNNPNFKIDPVTIKITCNAANREAAVILDNLLPMGDFEPPFAISTTIVDIGWSWSTAAQHSFNTTYHKFGTRSLRLSGTTFGVLQSPVIKLPEDATLVISFWLRGTITGGTSHWFLNKVQNGVTTGLFDFAPGTNVSDWTQYSTSPFTLPAGQPLSIASATSGAGSTFDLYFDGMAVWRNPTGSVAPTEYFTAGRYFNVPTGNAYGIRGDIESPFVMSLNWEKRSGAGVNNNPRYFLLGMNPIKWGTDYPLLGLDLQTANGASSNSLFWGTQGNSVTGAPLTGTSTFALTGTSIGKTVGGQPRKYRAFLVYAAYTTGSTPFTNVTVTLGKDVKTYSASLIVTPGMGPANTPISTNYGLYDLGDFLYPRPGSIGIERTYTLSTSDSIAIDFTGGTTTRFFLGGILLIPADQFIYIDLGAATGSSAYNPVISNESTAVKAMLAQRNGGADPVYSTYLTTGLLSELNSFNTSAYFTADSIELEPGDTHFEMFSAEGFQTTSAGASTGYYYFYDDAYLQPVLIYAPRNLTGAV